MGFDRETRVFEEDRLKHVLDRIRIQLVECRESADKKKSGTIAIQKSMWDHINPTPGDLDDLANIWQYQTEVEREGRKAIFASSRITRLEKMLQNPYFGRIDFKEESVIDGDNNENDYVKNNESINDDNNVEKIYIGISNLTDKSGGEYLVYDWRAPVASMFYDYETGKAGYDCPAGRVEGELLLKRQFRIWDGHMELMFDCSLAIGDEILQEILSKSADSRMKAIVTSIQREQNKIIRDDIHRLLVVQGPAGSGKTSIALHRAAYLLFRYREHILADNLVIFSPNEIFSDYISDVLPELGEENIHRTTFLEYARKALGEGEGLELEDAGHQMEYLLGSGKYPGFRSRVEGIKYKSSRKYVDVIKRYADYVEKGRRFEDVSYENILIETKEEITEYFFKDLKIIPVFRRLEKIRSRLTGKLDVLIRGRIEEVMLELRKTGEYPDKAEIRGRSTIIVREEFKPVRDKVERMTALDVLECYGGIFKERELLKSSSGNNLPECIDEIAAYTEKAIHEMRICWEDIAPMLLLKGLLYGFPSMENIRHVIVDEVQDYTAVQFELFRQLFGHCGMTMLGDLDQSINPYMNAGSYTAVTGILGYDTSMVMHLSKSYRSTRQITAFCRGILPHADNTGYMDRGGELPEVFCDVDAELIDRAVIKDIQDCKKHGFKSIALITRTAKDSRILYERLYQAEKSPQADKPSQADKSPEADESSQVEKSSQADYFPQTGGIRLVTSDDGEFAAGTSVLPSYLAKGLEFDAVLVYVCDIDDYGCEEERKLFYTVCTRALHRLRIYCKGGLPLIIRGLDSALYKINPRFDFS